MERYKLGELIDVTRGASLAGDNYATEGELVRLTLGNFDYQSNGFKQNSSKDNIFYNGEVDSSFILEEGDIITPLTEQAIGLLGSTAKIPESGKYIQSQDVALVKVKSEKLVHDFAYYLLPTASVKKQLSAGAQQTSIRHTSPDKIKDCTVYIPEPTEQQKIADFLNQIEEKIAINKKENETLEAMAKQLYDYWFIQFDFPDANGRPYKTSGGKMVWNETLKREIPEGWEDEQIMSSFHVVNGATPSTKEASNYGEEIIWITPKDLSEQQSKFTYKGARSITQKGYDSCSTSLIPSGSILMSSRAPIGLVSIAANELCTNQGFKSFYSDNPDYNLYLYYYILDHMKQIEQLGSGTTFKEVSRESISAFPIIAAYKKDCYATWVEQIKPIFEKQATLVSENNTLTETRDFLLPLLMNGQIKL